jgi:hypothetical protein
MNNDKPMSFPFFFTSCMIMAGIGIMGGIQIGSKIERDKQKEQKNEIETINTNKCLWVDPVRLYYFPVRRFETHFINEQERYCWS